MTKRLIKVIRIVLVNFLVLVVLLEFTSVAAYFIKTREFFYTRDKGRIAASSSDLQQPAATDWSLVFQLHPYFGYVTQESYVQNFARQYGYATHDHVFLTPYNLPFKKTRDQFVIGLFGGSVAHQVNVYELKNHVLADALHRLPKLKDKEIIILNFAQGAYKQPQQLLVLSYFLSIGQELDMVINIDGFNEIALAYANNKSGIDPAMPAGFVFAPLVDLANRDFSSEQLILVLEVAQTRNKLKDALNRLQNCKFATSYALRWGYVKYLDRRYRQKLEELAQPRKGDQAIDSLVRLDRIEKPLDDQEAVKQIVDLWANSALSMNELLSARKIPYLEFIQPNQYHATSRHFTEQEKRTAIAQSGLTREAITKGYPELLLRVERLRASGVNIFSAVNVLDQVNKPMYIDSCCHINDLGLEVLTKYIAANTVTLLESQAGNQRSKHNANSESK